MTFVRNDYVVRRTTRGKTNGCFGGKSTYRDWWFIKYGSSGGTARQLRIGSITLPNKYIGKKIRLKIEVIEEE